MPALAATSASTGYSSLDFLERAVLIAEAKKKKALAKGRLEIGMANPKNKQPRSSLKQSIFITEIKKKKNKEIRGSIDRPYLSENRSEELAKGINKLFSKKLPACFAGTRDAINDRKGLSENYYAQGALKAGEFAAKINHLQEANAMGEGITASEIGAAGCTSATDPLNIWVAFNSTDNFIQLRAKENQAWRILLQNLNAFKRYDTYQKRQDAQGFWAFVTAAKFLSQHDQRFNSSNASFARETPLKMIGRGLSIIHTCTGGDALPIVSSALNVGVGITDAVQASEEFSIHAQEDAEVRAKILALRKSCNELFPEALPKTQTPATESDENQCYEQKINQPQIFDLERLDKNKRRAFYIHQSFTNHFQKIHQQKKREKWFDRFIRATRGITNIVTGLTQFGIGIAIACGALAGGIAGTGGILLAAIAAIALLAGIGYAIGRAIIYFHQHRASHHAKQQQRIAQSLIRDFSEKELRKMFANNETLDVAFERTTSTNETYTKMKRINITDITYIALHLLASDLCRYVREEKLSVEKKSASLAYIPRLLGSFGLEKDSQQSLLDSIKDMFDTKQNQQKSSENEKRKIISLHKKKQSQLGFLESIALQEVKSQSGYLAKTTHQEKAKVDTLESIKSMLAARLTMEYRSAPNLGKAARAANRLNIKVRPIA